MASRTTRWHHGEVQPPPPTARRALWLMLLAVLSADLIIGLARLGAPEPDDVAVVDGDSLRRQLERAAADPDPWLLVGDSVLAGDVMAGRVADWQSQRVIDGMRRHLGPEAPESLHQVALNGLLVGDVEGVVAELDRVDPEARTGLIIELNPRVFSAVHAAADCSRDWLCDLRPAVRDRGLDPLRWAALTLREGRLRLHRIVPLLRHRAADLPDPAAALVPAADPDPGPADTGRARVRRHYTHRITGDRSTQWRALDRIVRRIRATGRRAVFFAPPLSDGFFGDALSRRHLGGLMAELSGLIDRPDDPRARFVPLDHPLFADGHFIDHCHLWPEGNRLLALNLLHAIGAPLDHAPPRTAMVAPEGSDRTLMASPERGYAEGPAWRALTLGVEGIAVAPGGRRVVVADTGNHVLRALVGDLATTRLLAGQPRRAGHADGPATDALLARPRDPLIVGDAVWFTTDRGRHLRRLAHGVVTTAYVIDGPRWHTIDAIRSHGDAILVLDRGQGVLRYTPAERRTERLLDASRLRGMAAAPDGRLWVADADSRIFAGRADRPFTLGDPIFGNTAPTPLPERRGAYFPYRFEQVRLLGLHDMLYVPRYDGLLVQDWHETPRPVLAASKHLRFFSLGDRRVYPWMKPRAFGWAEMLPNEKRDAWMSPWHRGAMALDPTTGTLLYAERQRSRIHAIRDGILGAAKLSHTPTRKVFYGMQERYGARSGRTAQRRLRPDRHLGAQGRPPSRTRAGPYVVLLIGSSYLAVSDMLGPYSFGRRLEQHLEAELGYRAGAGVELYQRTRAGGKLSQLVDLFEDAVDAGLAPDALIFGLQDSAGTFLRGLDGPDAVAAAVDRLRRTASRYDTRVFALDSAPLIARGDEGLRAPRRMMRPLFETFEGTGIPVLHLGEMLLADHLDAAPWGAPPYDRNHPAPWAIDAAAARMAHALTPALIAHFADRRPGWDRPPVPQPEDDRPPLRTALDGAGAWTGPAVPGSRLQAERIRGELRLFVDLADAPDGWRAPETARTLALGTLRALLEDDPAAGAARVARVRVARFANYDEYGQGVLEGARVVYDEAWTAPALRRAFAEASAR